MALDPRNDPDRFDGRQNLIELVGEDRSFEGERDDHRWAYGLLAAPGSLAPVALFSDVPSP